MSQRIRQVRWAARLAGAWCGLMHASTMWPIHGHYQCGVCGRRYPVPWERGAGA